MLLSAYTFANIAQDQPAEIAGRFKLYHQQNTRSFGRPTCGLSTGIVEYELSDRSTLGLAISFFVDRNLQVFDGPILPDELTDPENTLQIAADWIESE